MESKIIGKLTLNNEYLKNDIQSVLNFKFSKAYNEFALGDWKTCVIWNKTGNANDAMIEEYAGSARVTELAHCIPYINKIITENFDAKYLKFARIFSVSNYGLVIPHRDYLEFRSNFSRLHIPLQTDLSCFNSESDDVFHMKKGEIWYLEASNIHSAACFSNIIRLHLVLDFESSVELKDLLSPCLYDLNIEPTLVERKPISKAYLQNLINLYKITNENNFKDIISLLSKVHFSYNINPYFLFDWIMNIAEKTKNENIIKKCLLIKDGCINHRENGNMYNINNTIR